MRSATLWIAVLLLCTGVIPRASACSGDYGQQIGSFRGVPAYSNGNNYDCTGTGEGTYQCVEYVKRFYSNAMHFTTSGWTGNGNMYFGSAEAKGLRAFAQGGTTSPKENDILCFGGGPGGYGHVGIVTEVTENSVSVIDQNRHPSDPILTLGLTVTDGHYEVDDIGTLYVQGWLRGQTCEYSSQWNSIDETEPIDLTPGQSCNFKVWFTNTSSDNAPDWANDGGYQSIELRSCNSAGAEASCFLLPVDGKPAWLDPTSRKRIVRASSSGIGTNQTALFDFWGKVPESATPGLYRIYLRPYHNSAEWIQDWGGMHFQVNVVEPTNGYDMFLIDMDHDGKLDLVGWNTETGEVYIAKRHATNKTFVPVQDPGIEGFCTTDAYTRFVADIDNDGYPDLVGHKWSVGRWYVAYNQHDYTFDYGGSASMYGFCGTADYKPFVADINHDGYPDIGSHLWTNGKWFVAFNQQDGTFDNAGFLLNGFCGAETYKPFVADVDDDGYLDFCGHKYTDGKWYYASNHHSTFDYGGSASISGFCASTEYITNVSDWNGDGAADFWGYKTTTDGIYIAYNNGNGGSFSYPGSPGISGFGDADASHRLTVGDVTGDGKLDAVYSSPATGSVIVAKHNTTTLSIVNGDGQNNTWLTGWCVESGGSGKLADESPPETVPSKFALSQNYPNPFNPATTISYSLPSATHVRLDVFNILGQKVQTLVDEYQSAGEHTVLWESAGYASGIYLYRLSTPETVETKKMILLK